MKFSPYELGILLHYYVSPTDYPYNDAPIWPETVNRLRWLGLMAGNLDTNSDHRLTPCGEAFVRLSLCEAPIPEQQWVLPARDVGAVTP